MKKIILEWKWVIVILPLILLIAFLLRIYNLTILPIFADEAIYIKWSQIMVSAPEHRFLPLIDGKQPMYMWVLMFLVRRFSDPLFIGRLVSVFSGLGTIVGIFALSFYLFKNKKVSLIASLFWALSPYSFFFDRMALVDSMLAMFFVWTTFFAALTSKTKRLDMAMLTGFCLGFASLTKSPAFFGAILIPASWILSSWPKGFKEKVVNFVQLALLIMPTYLIAGGMYNIQRLGPNFSSLSIRTADYVFPISHLWTNPKDPFLPYFDRAIEWLRMLGPWPILILVIIGLMLNFKKYWKENLFLLAWWAVPTLIQSEFAKVFTARYELYTISYLFIIAASVFLTKNKKIFWIATAIFILWIAMSLRFNYLLVTDPQKAPLPRSERSGYLEEWTAGTGIREVADFIKTEHNANPAQVITIGTEGHFGTLPDGLQIYLDGTPNVNVIGIGLGINQVPIDLINAKKAGNKTYLVINSSRLKIKPEQFEEFGLKVIKTFKKADRPAEGYKETAQYGLFDTFYLFEVISIEKY